MCSCHDSYTACVYLSRILMNLFFFLLLFPARSYQRSHVLKEGCDFLKARISVSFKQSCGEAGASLSERDSRGAAGLIKTNQITCLDLHTHFTLRDLFFLGTSGRNPPNTEPARLARAIALAVKCAYFLKQAKGVLKISSWVLYSLVVFLSPSAAIHSLCTRLHFDTPIGPDFMHLKSNRKIMIQGALVFCGNHRDPHVVLHSTPEDS